MAERRVGREVIECSSEGEAETQRLLGQTPDLPVFTCSTTGAARRRFETHPRGVTSWAG